MMHAIKGLATTSHNRISPAASETIGCVMNMHFCRKGSNAFNCRPISFVHSFLYVIIIRHTTSFYAMQFLPEEYFFLKRPVLTELIESGIMISRNGKWIIKKLEK